MTLLKGAGWRAAPVWLRAAGMPRTVSRIAPPAGLGYCRPVFESRDLLTLIQTGGAVMYPLLACSIVTMAIILERLWAIRRVTRAAEKLHNLVIESAGEGNLSDALAISRRDESPLAQVYKAVLGQPELDETLRARLAQQRQAAAARGLKRNIWLVGTIGSLAPFIGLLGTVIGIVRAFENMAATGSGGFAVVAAGISEALIATAAGLLVGVTSIFAYNAFNVRIANLMAQWREWTDELLIQISHPPRSREGSLPRVVQSR